MHPRVEKARQSSRAEHTMSWLQAFISALDSSLGIHFGGKRNTNLSETNTPSNHNDAIRNQKKRCSDNGCPEHDEMGVESTKMENESSIDIIENATTSIQRGADAYNGDLAERRLSQID